MPATLASLTQETGHLLGDPRDITAGEEGRRFKNAAVKLYLNEAQEEMNRLAGVLRVDVEITLKPSEARVKVVDRNGAVPEARILRVEFKADLKPIYRATKDELDAVAPGWQNLAPGKPAYWLPDTGGYGVLRFVPHVSVDTEILAWIAQKPPEMGDAEDAPAIGDVYADALPFYAAWKCLLRNRESADLEMAKSYQQEWRDRVKQAQNDELGVKAA